MNTLPLLLADSKDAALHAPNHFREQRVRYAERQVLRGISYSQLIAELCGKFDVCQRTAESYVSDARRRIKETISKDRETEIAIAKERFETVMYAAFQANQLAVAAAANREIVKLLGLAEPDRVEHGASDSLTELVSQIRQGNMVG